jgi:hypothetical protein
MTVEPALTITTLRDTLQTFWEGAVSIEPHREALAFTMPASYPDGWQIVLEISQKTPKGFRLSDRGRTIAWLTGRGQNVHTEAMRRHLERLCKECRMDLDCGEFFRWLEAPLDGTDIQVFTEGLVAASHLHVLHEHRVAEENVAEATVQRVLMDSGMQSDRNHKLSITKDRKVSVDFYAEAKRAVAIELIKSKHDLSGKMERWGFRWDELRKSHQSLMPVMLYDRNTMLVDSYSRHIGEEKCELFCGYDETDRIHDVLEKAR